MLAVFANDFITHCEHIVCIILCVCIHKHCTCCDHVIPLLYHVISYSILNGLMNTRMNYPPVR